ncbi:MAG: aminotransferase class V-fold PLP-dependent enzyme [Planctomycetota bacterium]
MTPESPTATTIARAETMLETKTTPRFPGMPEPSPLARHWTLSKDITFLNHGSYGASPSDVIAEQRRIQDLMEAEPVNFFLIELERLSDETRRVLGEFVGAEPENIALLPNATTAVATVIHNLDLKPGDEVLVNSHEYASCLSEFDRLARAKGFKIIEAKLPFPAASSSHLRDAILDAMTERTRVCLVSSVTSPSALVLPVEEIVDECRQRGIISIVDGAHAPGQMRCSVEKLGCDFFAANLHKWICAPKGAAFLWVHPKHQNGFEPLTLSSRARFVREDRSPFLGLFDYVGTKDYSSVLAAPVAVRTIGSMLPGGWDEVIEQNHRLVLEGRDILCDRLGIIPTCPDELNGSMSALILPGKTEAYGAVRAGRYDDPVQHELVTRFGIQVPVWGTGSGTRVIRISAQLYNTPAQYEYLADALKKILPAP